MGRYDRIMKLLVDYDPSAIARFVLKEWQKQRGANAPDMQVTSVVLLSEEFQSEELKGDGVWLIHGPEGPQLLTSVEYQSTLTPIMPIRSMEYLARSKKKHWKTCGHLPAIGVVLFLFDEDDTACPMVWPGPDGTTTLAYNYVRINLRTIPRAEILALQEPALWPLALLTKGPVDRIIVKNMFTDLLANKLYNILPIGNTVAAWFLRGSDLTWLEEEYQKMYDIFKDSPAIQWIQESGRADERRIAEEERQKLLADFQQTAIIIVAQQYPTLKRLAQTQLRQLTDTHRLQQLIVDLSMARTSNDTQNILLALSGDPGEKDTDAVEVVSPPPSEA